MPFEAMTQYSDSQNPDAPLSCSENERPPVYLTPAAYGGLNEELDKARRAWLHYRIPTKSGPRRIAALAKEAKLRERYEQLLGHPIGKPVALPMDSLPHLD